jgi:hypothetical protein
VLVLSVRKGGHDVDEFAPHVLQLRPGTDEWLPADPADFSHPFAAFFHGYNCEIDLPEDKALDAARSIAQIATSVHLPYQPVCCLWPGLGETKLQAIRFHQAIRHARRAARLYAEFFSLTKGAYLLCGHSLGCGLIGWLLAEVARPADLAIWMGAAVPQYATATVDPRKHSRDWIGAWSSQHLFDFAPAIARKTRRLVNVFGDDPVLKTAFEKAVRSRACGAFGAWPGPERLANVIDLDVTRQVKKHGHYRHLLPMWRELRGHIQDVLLESL